MKIEVAECEKCEYYNGDTEECGAFVCDGIDCPTLPCEEENALAK